MRRRRTIRSAIVMGILVLPGLLSCSLLSGMSGSQPAPDRFAEKICTPLEHPRGIRTTWPENLPPEIPPLDAEIISVIGGGGITRVFYGNVTAEKINAYVDLLESAGYAITAIRYEREGFPSADTAIDAIDAVKGGYKIRIEYGCGQADLMIEQQ